MNRAIWNRDEKLPGFPELTSDLKTEVAIIGGGMAGLLCAWKLKQLGVFCTVLEADTVCSGITGNTTAKLTLHHGAVYSKILRRCGAEQAKLYYRANREALEAYAGLAARIDCDYRREANYLYARNSAAELEEEILALRQLEIPFSQVKDIPLPFPVAGAIRMDAQAAFHPLKLLAELLKGLNVYEHTKVTGFANGELITQKGSIKASRILVATHFPIWNRHGGYFMKMYQERSYVLALENAPQPDGMFLDISGKGLSFRNYGKYLLLGGGTHRTGKNGKGWEPVRNAAKQFYPGSVEAAHWAAQDCMTLDGIPYIGRYGNNTPNVYVATGFNKWGMTSSMVAADILSDLMTGKENPYAACFSPQRSSLHLQLLSNALESAVHLVNPVGPRCPHLGCSLKWNPWEHSWDCPCHGSRFDKQGSILDGPATGNLPQKD